MLFSLSWTLAKFRVLPSTQMQQQQLLACSHAILPCEFLSSSPLGAGQQQSLLAPLFPHAFATPCGFAERHSLQVIQLHLKLLDAPCGGVFWCHSKEPLCVHWLRIFWLPRSRVFDTTQNVLQAVLGCGWSSIERKCHGSRLLVRGIPIDCSSLHQNFPVKSPSHHLKPKYEPGNMAALAQSEPGSMPDCCKKTAPV